MLVKAQETVRFIAVFEDFADDNVPYMYHCHMLTHEDMGMMGQFSVSTQVGIKENSLVNLLDVYPNPSNGTTEIRTQGNVEIQIVDIYSVDGKLVLSKRFINNPKAVKLNNLDAGILFIRVTTNQGIETKKLIVK